MSDHSDHSHEVPPTPSAPIGPLILASEYSDGGHEIDATPNRNLMVFLVLMATFILLSSLGVYQLFSNHADSLLSEAATGVLPQLAELHKHEAEFASSYGTIEVEGKVVAYRMPFGEAERAVLANPTLFAAAPPPAGWVHPDDAGTK